MFSRIAQLWHNFINPQDLEAAFICTITFLRAAGLFPYKQSPTGFQLSYPLLLITSMHFSLYTFVNFEMMVLEPAVLAKLVIVDNYLAISSNLFIRVIGMIISVSAFVSVFTGMKNFTIVLNRYIVLMELLDELGIDTRNILKKMLISSASATFFVFLISLYLIIQSSVFYEKIANEKPPLRFFGVVVLANYYKNTCLFAMSSYMFTSFQILSLLNRFLKDLLRRHVAEVLTRSRHSNNMISMA